jgi:hypothetical protein
MAALSYTYATLLASLQDWPENDDADYILALPNIIKMGELRVYRDLNLEGCMVATDSATMTLATETVTKPTNMLAARELYYTRSSVRYHMIRETPEFVRAYNAMGATGNPRFYGEEDESTWVIAPVPDATGAGTLSVRLTRNPTGLDVSTPASTSYLSTQLPDLLFASCLMSGARYLKNDPRWADAKREYDLLIADVRPKVSALKLVQWEDETKNRQVARPDPSDGPPQNQ